MSVSEVFSNWSAVISATCAFFALLGTAFSWWQSNLSAQSKAESIHQRKLAEDAASNASKQREAIEKLRQSFDNFRDELMPSIESLTGQSGRGITANWQSENTFILRNASNRPFICEYVRNREKFVVLELTDNFSLNPGESISVCAIGASGMPVPSDLVLDEVGEDNPVYVSLEKK